MLRDIWNPRTGEWSIIALKVLMRIVIIFCTKNLWLWLYLWQSCIVCAYRLKLQNLDISSRWIKSCKLWKVFTFWAFLGIRFWIEIDVSWLQVPDLEVLCNTLYECNLKTGFLPICHTAVFITVVSNLQKEGHIFLMTPYTQQ